MKTIGIIGGITWESTKEYYHFLNTGIKNKLGGKNSAKIILQSLNFSEIEKLSKDENWDQLAIIFTKAALNIQNAGADFILIAANTMHLLVPEIEKLVNIPILHIADVTAKSIQSKKIKKVGLLGTKYTMQLDFYKTRLSQLFNIEVVTPEYNDMDIINNVIYNELSLGVLKKESKENYLNIIQKLKDKGAEGVILGCTEIPLLIKDEDCDIPVFNTTKLHCEAAVKIAIE